MGRGGRPRTCGFGDAASPAPSATTRARGTSTRCSSPKGPRPAPGRPRSAPARTPTERPSLASQLFAESTSMPPSGRPERGNSTGPFHAAGGGHRIPGRRPLAGRPDRGRLRVGDLQLGHLDGPPRPPVTPPTQFRQWRLSMRPWHVFVAQVLQFQDCAGRPAPRNRLRHGPHLEGPGAARARRGQCRAGQSHQAQGHQQLENLRSGGRRRLHLRGAAIEPVLLVDPEGSRLRRVAHRPVPAVPAPDQRGAGAGPPSGWRQGGDQPPGARARRPGPDPAGPRVEAQAVQEAQHRDRIPLDGGQGAKPAVDVLVPGGPVGEDPKTCPCRTYPFDWVAFASAATAGSSSRQEVEFAGGHGGVFTDLSGLSEGRGPARRRRCDAAWGVARPTSPRLDGTGRSRARAEAGRAELPGAELGGTRRRRLPGAYCVQTPGSRRAVTGFPPVDTGSGSPGSAVRAFPAGRGILATTLCLLHAPVPSRGGRETPVRQSSFLVGPRELPGVRV